ncbi:Hypothetical predicted protein [Mytilus galloprovincialis]|nr:Hypothetical predicted protein [Mytilus galloprovincialis]
MDREDKRRYFYIGSVYLEVVTPLFQQKLEEHYKSLNFRSLKDFLDKEAVIHILFHLRHRNAWCCADKANCTNQGALPLNHHQWKQLFAENPGPGIHNCFCKYTAKSINLVDLDVSLCGLILYNCCNLGQLDQDAVHILRRNKNDYLSHNTTCGITRDEYGPLIDELKTSILQLDQAKEDELIRILKRPLDDSLCNKYVTYLLDNHEMLERIYSRIDHSETHILNTMNRNKTQLSAQIEELKQTVVFQNGREKLDKQGIEEQPIDTFKMGQSIFALHHLIDLTSEIGDDFSRVVPAAVMMDDGRMVICLPDLHKLLICNTDGSNVDRIHTHEGPWAVTAVNDSTVAVLMLVMRIELYDINTKHNIKSISVPGMWLGTGITTINNKLVVYAERTLQIIDHQTDKVVQTIDTECGPYRLHGSGDRIFYYNNANDFNNKLYWYSYTDEQHDTVKLPSQPMCMTTLQDGSLYVVCKDGSVRHVSRDCQQYETVTTEGLERLKYYWMLYNKKQGKLVTKGDQKTIFKVFYKI